MRGKVLIAAPVHPVLTNRLLQLGYELVLALDIKQATAPELVTSVVGIITYTRLQLDKALLDAAPLLQWIGRMGSGMEVIDVAYATAKGVTCFSSPDGNANAVGEHALGLLLSLTKNIQRSNLEVMKGKWLREENRGLELEGKTIGIIGFGYTGKAFVKKLRGFDMNILVYDKYQQDPTEEQVTFCDDLSLIYQQAEIISFHVPLQVDTHHYFNTDFLQQLKNNIILLNTSRGTVVETTALETGLETGKIVAAGLDVFEEEPPAQMSKEILEKFQQVSQRSNVIITPHIAGYTHDALYKMSRILAEKTTLLSND